MYAQMETLVWQPVYQRKAMWMMGFINLVTMWLSLRLAFTLEPEDKVSIRRGSALAVLGFVYFISMFECLNRILMYTSTGHRFRRKYNLCEGDLIDISNKFVSAVQAALCCLAGVVVCLWSCTRDFLMSSHFMSEAYAWFGAAYFFYDIWSMYTVHVAMNYEDNPMRARVQRKLTRSGNAPLSAGDALVRNPEMPSFLDYCKSEPVILMHHLFIGGFGFLVIVYLRGGLGDCIFGVVYLMELSTPFVSFRGILSRMKLKESKAYLINGILMLLTFFVCRVASLPYLCLVYSREIGLPYFESILLLPTGCKISICILLLPQLYWFYLMMWGALKMARGGARDKSGAALGGAKQALSAGDAAAKEKRS